MRRFLAIAAACLLLTGCGQNQVDAMISEPEQNGLLLEQAEITENASIKLATEWDVYDPSVEEIWFWIENDSGNDVTFGQEYTLEKWLETDGGVQDWYQVPLREDVGWESVLYLLASGGKQAGCCRLSLFDNTFSSGDRLRIVKEVEGQTVAAEFRLEEGTAVSVETPYGFGALEELPERYGAAEAAGSGAVIYTSRGVENGEAVGTFLEKVSLGIPCQLRTVQDFGEGMPMDIDVIYENGGFLWKMRSGGEVTQRRLSFLVTDGTDLFLSDGANWEFGERFDDKRVFLVPPEMGHAWVAEVEAMTEARLSNSAIRYTLWSEDGSRSVSLLEEDGVVAVFLRLPDGGEKSWTETLPADSGTITALSWQEDGTLRLECETDGGASILTLNPETGEWTQLMICGLPQAQVAGWNGRGKSI